MDEEESTHGGDEGLHMPRKMAKLSRKNDPAKPWQERTPAARRWLSGPWSPRLRRWGHRALNGALDPILLRPVLFSSGWGDRSLFDDTLARCVAQDLRAVPAEMGIQLHRRPSWGGVRRWHGRFMSPTPELPVECKPGRFELLLPDTPHSALGSVPVCVYLPGTGDEGFAFRRWFALPLVRQGIGALILQTPFYGRRRAHGQRFCFLHTVTDQIRMNLGTVEESLGLLAWLQEQGPAPIGVMGYSQGGYTAAYVAATAKRALAVAIEAAGVCGGTVMSQHHVHRAVDWKALAATLPPGYDASAHAPEAVRIEAAKACFADVMSPLDLRNFPQPVAPHKAIVVAGRHDTYVPLSQAQALHAHWQGSSLRVCDAGHASMLLLETQFCRQAVLDSFGSAAVGTEAHGGPYPGYGA